jgi:hypothetical protein
MADHRTATDEAATEKLDDRRDVPAGEPPSAGQVAPNPEYRREIIRAILGVTAVAAWLAVCLLLRYLM